MLNKAISQYPNNTFEPEVVTAMGRAFDLAMPEILASADPKAQSEAVAKRIVEIARLGERDPHMLCAYGLARSALDSGTTRSRPIARSDARID